MMKVIVAQPGEDLERHAGAWDDLSRHALEPNVFYESWMLRPALRHLGRGRHLRIVLVFLPGAGRHGEPLLCGLFPVECRRPRRIPSVTTLRLWRHEYCFLGTPLLRSGYAAEALALFLDWAATRPWSSGLVELGAAAGGGLFGPLLDGALLARAPWWRRTTRRSSRALYRPAAGAAEYLRAALRGKRRKELKRQMSRLAEAGRVEFLEAEGVADAGIWTERFLELEAGGWKGRNRTALASGAGSADFFRAVVLEAARRDRLMMLGLFVDARPIAMKCSLLAGDGSFAFKIAYDEAFARFSPGLLLEIENLRRLHRRPEIRWMDSCADEDNDMINRLWLDRRDLATTLVSLGSPAADLRVRWAATRAWLRTRLAPGTPPGAGRAAAAAGEAAR